MRSDKKIVSSPLPLPLPPPSRLKGSPRRGQMSGQVRPDLSVLSGFSEVAKGDKPPFSGRTLALSHRQSPTLHSPSLSQPNWYWGWIFHGGRGQPGFVRFCLFPIDFLDRSTPAGLHFVLNCCQSLTTPQKYKKCQMI